MPDLTVTIPGEAIAAYLALGAILWLPLEWKAWRSIHQRHQWPFWRELWRGLRTRPLALPLIIVAWPVALWDTYR